MHDPNKIAKAKVQLILNEPFFATLAFHMEYLCDNSIKTATINGKQIKFNQSYIDNLSVDELVGVLAHLVMHTALLHHTRRDNRDQKKWNQAADYAVNPVLIDAKFLLPLDFLINDDYRDKSVEQIYNLLPIGEDPDGSQGKDQSGNDDNPHNESHSPGGTGDVEDPPSDTNIQQAESEMKQLISQAKFVAKQQGTLPASIERAVDDILKPKISWKEVLSRFLAEITKNDYSWKRPSPRYLHCGLYLPILEAVETGRIILIVDTSTSIDEAMINQFAAETNDIANTFNASLKIIYVDAEVQSTQDIEPGEDMQLHPKGGGGTDFRPGFEFIEKENLEPKAVVYLTDGECDDFPEEPAYPVLWAQFGSTDFLPPFGEAIQVS